MAELQGLEAIRAYIKAPDPETKTKLIAVYEAKLSAAIARCIEAINQVDARGFYDYGPDDRTITIKDATASDELEALLGDLISADISRPLVWLQVLKTGQKSPGKVVSAKVAAAFVAAMKEIHKHTQAPPPLMMEFMHFQAWDIVEEFFIAYAYRPYLDDLPEDADGSARMALHVKRSDMVRGTGILQKIPEILETLYPKQAAPVVAAGIDCFGLPSTAAGRLTAMVLNCPARVLTTKPSEINRHKDRVTGKDRITYKTPSNEITFTLSADLATVTNGPKLFDFFQQKANDQHWPEKGAGFNLQELIDVGIYADKDTAYRGLTSSVTHMQGIMIGGTVTAYEGRKAKKVANVGGPLVSWRQITYNQCYIKLAPIFSAGYTPIMPITDPNFRRLPKLAYMLYRYIMEQCRIKATSVKKQGYITLSMEAIRLNLGLPSIEEAGDHPKALIIDPIDKALGDIMDSAGLEGLKLEIITQYDQSKPRPPVSDYLSGYIKATPDKIALEILEDRATEKGKEIQKAKAAKAAKVAKAKAAK